MPANNNFHQLQRLGILQQLRSIVVIKFDIQFLIVVQYITKLRELTAEFCVKKDNANAYQLKLMMNPAGFIGWWDDEAFKLIEKIIESQDKSDIDKFVALMQSWLALEWHGIMNEGMSGILNKNKKGALRKQFYLEYKKYLKYKESCVQKQIKTSTIY